MKKKWFLMLFVLTLGNMCTAESIFCTQRAIYCTGSDSYASVYYYYSLEALGPMHCSGVSLPYYAYVEVRDSQGQVMADSVAECEDVSTLLQNCLIILGILKCFGIIP